MNLYENIKVALRSIRSNLLRAALTMSIIACGIMALVGILTAIDSAIYSLNDNFSGLGANSFSLSPKGEGVSGNRGGRRSKRGSVIEYRQAMDFKEKFHYPARVSTSVSCTSFASLKYKDKKTNPNVNVLGVDEAFMDVQGYNVSMGRNITANDNDHGTHVALVGQSIVDKLFDGKKAAALGETMAINSIKYRIIGILESKGSSMSSSGDRVAWIPLVNAKRYYGSKSQNYSINVSVHEASEVEEAVATATGVFRNVRKLKIGEENDFEIFKSDGLIEIIREDTTKFRLAAVAIGLITLLGAAIGLMNIMLVSVTERTREVGICKAIGATRTNILVQFLTEAIVICQMGGLVGIVLGILIGFGVSVLMKGPFVIPWAWITLGIVTCMVVGLISGIYPAMKASKLDPIESLRHE